MGFDFLGLSPSDRNGESFRVQWGDWYPMADYILETCEDLFQEHETDHWFSNDGQRVSEETAEVMGERLLKLVEDGSVEKYRTEKIGSGDEVVVNRIKAFAKFCLNSGGFWMS